MQITQDQLKLILDAQDPSLDKAKIVDGLVAKGVTIQGFNDKPATNTTSSAASQEGGSFMDKTKSAAAGFALGVGGPALSAIDYVGGKLVNKYGTPEMKANIANKPSLQDQFKQEFNTDNTAGNVGQVVGQVASLAAPVGAIGKLAGKGAELVGAGKNLQTLTKAATEGLAFTAGQAVAEGEKQSLKDYALNTGLNVLVPGAGMAAKSLSENLAPRIINSLIKPASKEFLYGKNPGKVIADLGITGNSFEELISNIQKTKDEVGNRIGQRISQVQTPLSLQDVNAFKYIDEALSKANLTPRTNASVIQRLESVKSDLQGVVDNAADNSLATAQEIKKVIGDLTKWTGNASDDKAVNKALQQTYSNVRNEMDNVLKKSLSPEEFKAYKADAENYGSLLSAENAATNRSAITERNDLVSFGARNSGFLAGLASVVAGGASLETLLATGAGVAFDKAMASPAFKTRLAATLSKLPQGEVKTLFDRLPQLNEVVPKEKFIKSASVGKSQVTQAMAGAPAGMEVDEEGNVNYDVWKALIGTAAIGGTAAYLANKGIKKAELEVLDNVLHNRDAGKKEIDAARKLLGMKDSATKAQILKKANLKAVEMVRGAKKK